MKRIMNILTYCLVLLYLALIAFTLFAKRINENLSKFIGEYFGVVVVIILIVLIILLIVERIIEKRKENFDDISNY